MTSDQDYTSKVDVKGEDIEWDLASKMTYGGYLQLDSLLAAQRPVSEEHDEMLFIIIHQASELWIKLILHEAQATLACIRNDQLEPAFKMLSRISRSQSILERHWNVLSTLTPSDYMKFRDKLGHAEID